MSLTLRYEFDYHAVHIYYILITSIIGRLHTATLNWSLTIRIHRRLCCSHSVITRVQCEMYSCDQQWSKPIYSFYFSGVVTAGKGRVRDHQYKGVTPQQSNMHLPACYTSAYVHVKGINFAPLQYHWANMTQSHVEAQQNSVWPRAATYGGGPIIRALIPYCCRLAEMAIASAQSSSLSSSCWGEGRGGPRPLLSVSRCAVPSGCSLGSCCLLASALGSTGQTISASCASQGGSGPFTTNIE